MNFILFYLYIVFGYSFKFLNIIRTTSNRIMNKKINIVLYNSYFLLELVQLVIQFVYPIDVYLNLKFFLKIT